MLPLPRPIAQPITRTSPAAQVAWLYSQDPQTAMRSLVGIDPGGATVGTIDATKLGTIARSGDGASLFFFTEDRVDVYSALDGKRGATYRAAGSRVSASAFSADGRWAALLVPPATLQLLDLRSGLSQTLAFPHDPKASLPGSSGNIASVIWATLAFAPDSTHVYVVSDWGGPASLSAYALTANVWAKTGSTTHGAGASLPACAGPALAISVMQAGRTLGAFCHFDGAVWLFDLPTLTSVNLPRPTQANPFWLSPVFTPDGQLIYLHQAASFGDEMQVVDVAARRVLGPAATPTRMGDRGPFAWLGTAAYAGWTASTQPISPDGLKLYSAFSGGVAVLRIPDLTPIATLASGAAVDEVWVSGDGKTIYATAGTRLIVAKDDGSGGTTVDLGRQYPLFIATERG